MSVVNDEALCSNHADPDYRRMSLQIQMMISATPSTDNERLLFEELSRACEENDQLCDFLLRPSNASRELRGQLSERDREKATELLKKLEGLPMTLDEEAAKVHLSCPTTASADVVPSATLTRVQLKSVVDEIEQVLATIPQKLQKIQDVIASSACFEENELLDSQIRETTTEVQKELSVSSNLLNSLASKT